MFNNYPSNTQFLAFNTRRKPWDDLRVRKAFMLLLNREQLIKTLFFNETRPLNCTFRAAPTKIPTIPRIVYNPQEALQVAG